MFKIPSRTLHTLIKGQRVRIDHTTRERVALFASVTSLSAASRRFGFALHTVRRWTIAFGYKPRRPGNFTNDEIMQRPELTKY